MEVWRDIPGFNGDYRVSNFGRICSTDRTRYIAPNNQSTRGHSVFIRGKIIKPGKMKNKAGKIRALGLRLRVDDRYVNISVHEAVLSAFVGPRPTGKYGCHRDDRPINTRLNNLDWGTPTENCADKIAHGNQPMGETIPWSKLTETDVRFIKSNRGLISQTEMAKMFDVPQSAISKAANGKTWKHVT